MQACACDREEEEQVLHCSGWVVFLLLLLSAGVVVLLFLIVPRATSKSYGVQLRSQGISPNRHD